MKALIFYSSITLTCSYLIYQSPHYSRMKTVIYLSDIVCLVENNSEAYWFSALTNRPQCK